MLTLVVENQSHGTFADLRGKLVRRLAHDAPSYSRVGASGKPGAVHLEDGDQPSKKFHGYRPLVSKSQVEQYLKHHFQRLANVREASEGELTALVHDLRHLSSSIYYSAIEAERAAKENSLHEARDLIKTIIASQTMLKVRIDYLDFSNSVNQFDEIEKIPVYSRVDKVIRCFKADARHKNIEINLSGNSYRLAEGPNILDIIPYTLIENAIKYSPKNSEITVRVQDTDAETEVSVTSFALNNTHVIDFAMKQGGFSGYGLQGFV